MRQNRLLQTDITKYPIKSAEEYPEHPHNAVDDAGLGDIDGSSRQFSK